MVSQRVSFRWLSLALLGGLAGCATVPPVYDPIRDSDFRGPTLAAAREQPDAFLQTQVRWGGALARVDNRRDETWLEIVEQPLQDNGRPASADDSGGRFLARVAGFLDPAIYATGRPITVVGVLADPAPGQVGEYRYTYPVVLAERHQLWSERRAPEVIYLPDPFWYGPGYGPFYPWGYRRGPFFW